MILHGPSVALTVAERSRIDSIQQLAMSAGNGIPELLAMLTDASWTVRREVVHTLAQLGTPAAKPLCELLRTHRDNEARIAATVDALAASASDVFQEVSALTRDENPAVVADAAQVLGRRRDSNAVPLLVGLVAHADDNVAVSAIEALGRIGGPSGIDTLILAAKSGKFFRVFPAIDVLGRSGDPRVIQPLASLLGVSTYMFEAARALGKTGETAAVAPLAALLAHSAVSTGRIAAVALYELHTRHKERYGAAGGPEDALRKASPGLAAIRRIAQSLNNADASEQVAISFVLGMFGGEPARAGLASLLDGSDQVAEAAASALKRLGNEAELEVREALRDGTSARRQVLLRNITRANAVPEIRECLGDADAMVRVLACDALARIGAVATVPDLFELLQDKNPRVVQAAIGAIQSLGSVETKRLALQHAAQGNLAAKRAALRILAYFGYGEALPYFIDALSNEDARLRDAALAGLAILDEPKALDAILTAARSTSEKTRSAAMRSLGQCTRKDARITSYLLQGLKDADAWVRYYACQALGRLQFENATQAITTLLLDEAGQVRVAAAEALSLLQTDEALKALQRAAEGDEPDVQRAALIGLGLSKRSEAWPILLRASKSVDPATRLVALSALAGSSSSHALPALAHAARDSDESVRVMALGFIAAIPGSEATAVLIDLLRGSAEAYRAERLLSVPTEGRIPGIVAALDTADDALAQALVSALTRMRTKDAKDALLQMMVAAPVAARKASAGALASLRTSEALAALKKAAATDADPQVRQIAAVLLSQ